MGAGVKRPLKEAAKEYVAQHYPTAYTKAYSLPEGYILSSQKFKELRTKAFRGEDVNMPLGNLSVAMVFDRVKSAFKDVPSLTVADYSFTDTLLKGIKQSQKEKFIRKFGVTQEDIKSGDHDVFSVGISDEGIVGLFFQIKGLNKDATPKTIADSLAKATKQTQKDINIFRTMCGEFLKPNVKLAGFTSFPMLSKLILAKFIRCRNCISRILTSEDLDNPDTFRNFLLTHEIALNDSWNPDSESPEMRTFKDIFDLYVSAASAVDLPRNPNQLFVKSEKQMKPMLVILTPQQRKLVLSESSVTFLSGGSGTGKTFVLKRRAMELTKKGEVLLINFAGGVLTDEFRHNFEGKALIIY